MGHLSEPLVALHPEPSAAFHPPSSRPSSRRRVIAAMAAAASIAGLVLCALVMSGPSEGFGNGSPSLKFVSMSEAYDKMSRMNAGDGAPDTYCLESDGYSKPTGNSLSIDRVNGVGSMKEYYFLSIMGEVGHEIRAILEGSDGYHKSWNGYGSVWTDKIHNVMTRGDDVVDYLQVQDLTNGEIAYFRFPCGGNAKGSINMNEKQDMPEAQCFKKDGDGYRKNVGGTLSVSKINGVGPKSDCYYLSIMGDVGHKLTAIVEGDDGYHRHWDGFGSIWSDCVHQNTGGSRGETHDFLQVQDETTGEVAYFEWPCTNPKGYMSGSTGEQDFPPLCERQHAGLGLSQSVCHGGGPGAMCGLCIDKEGYCKGTGGTLSVSKIDGVGGMKDYYFLSVMGDVGHEIRAVLQGSDGYNKDWTNYGSIWSDKIHKAGAGRPSDVVDHLQIQDMTTGETSFVQWPCVEDVASLRPEERAARSLPPMPPVAPAAAPTPAVEAPPPRDYAPTPSVEAPTPSPAGGPMVEGKIPLPAGPPGPDGKPGRDGEVRIEIIPGPPGPPGAPGRDGQSSVQVVQGPPGAPGSPGGDGGVVTKYYHQAGGEESHEACEFSYKGAMGPVNWGTICDGKYAVCGTGKEQSPVNIETSKLHPEPTLTNIGWNIPVDQYEKHVVVAATEEFGHAFEVQHVKATFAFAGANYKLKQFHIHTPSEHTLDGVAADMEIHFVHSLDGKVLVVSALFKVSEHGSPAFIKDLVSAIPSITSTPKSIVPVDFAQLSQLVMIGSLPHTGANPKDFVPNFKNYMTYDGSFTTPPCTQGVQWLVLRNPMHVSQDDVDALRKLEGVNARPVQPLGDRVVSTTV